MKKKRPVLTIDVAKKNLQVLVNGVRWIVDKIDVLKRGDREQWVYMDISDPHNKESQNYLVERKGMVKAWLALVKGEKNLSQIKAIINSEKWICRDVDIFDREGLEWIKIIVVHPKTTEEIQLEIDREGMVNAYWAMEPSFEDILGGAIDAAEGFIENL